MTKKEVEKQAEEWLENNCIESYKQGCYELFELWKSCFIKWHNLKKCSDDLPPRSKADYLNSVVVSNEYGEPIYYDYGIDEWCDMEGDVVSECYKHWCELPQFKE